MRIALCFDDNYCNYGMVVIESIIINSKTKKDFLIVYVSLTEENILKIKKKFDNRIGSIEFIKLEKNLISNINYGNHGTFSHVSVSTYIRLIIPNLVSDDFILYLDSDLLVLDDVDNIIDNNILGDKIILVVEEVFMQKKYKNYKKEILKKEEDFPYFNAGVMVINCKEWRKENITNSLINILNKDSYVFFDQDVLNIFFSPKDIKFINPKWNACTIFDKNSWEKYLSYNKLEIEEALLNPSIVHFTGPDKPWNYSTIHPYKEKYLEYYKECFGEIQYGDINFKSYIRKWYLKMKYLIVQLIKHTIPEEYFLYLKKMKNEKFD